MICFICKKEFKENNFGTHLRICKKIHKLKGSLDDIKYKQLKYHYKKRFSKDFFIREYVKNEKSILAISQEFKCVYSHVAFLLRYLNIERRTLKEESNTKKTRNKCKETCKKLYGVDNPSKSKKIQQQKKETFLKHYGVDNIFKDKKFKEWMAVNNFAWNSRTDEENKLRVKKQTKSIKEFWHSNNDYIKEIKKQNTEKYRSFLNSLSDEELKKYNKKKGAWWHLLTDEQKTAYLLKRVNTTSKLETKIAEILLFLSISFSTQKFINKTSYDFFLNNTKILIEVQGDFWHGNPEIYKENDILKHPMKGILAKEQWKKDDDKRINAEKYGYKVIYIWEAEMNKKTNIELTELIINKLKI